MWTLIMTAGLAVGVLYGLFGVGSSFATPVLAVIGVPGMAAVVGPLPGLLPGSAAAALSSARHGSVDWWVAKRTLVAAAPMAIVGSVFSHAVGGRALVIASGFVLLVVGIRILQAGSTPPEHPWAHDHAVLLGVSAAGVGFVSGLLANGGGFLLVPLFLLVVGLEMRTASGTSLVVATALTVPTLVTHALRGDIDWTVSLLFAAGLVPGAWLGAALANRVPTARLRGAFAVVLIGFAVWFLGRQAGFLIPGLA